MTNLEKKIAARNAVNTLAVRLLPQIRAGLTPLINKKICHRSMGGCLPNFTNAVSALMLPNTATETVYISTGQGHFVTANFRVAGLFPGFPGFAAVYLFAIKEGKMVHDTNRLPRTEPLRTDITASEIIAARIEIANAHSTLRAAAFRLCGFGETAHSDNTVT